MKFPLGVAKSLTSWNMILAVILSALLLPVGIVMGAVGFTYAQMPPIVAQAAATPEATKQALEIAEHLAGKPLSYYLIVLAGFIVTTWTMIVRWLLAQLNEQRKAHNEVNAKLLDYVSGDRSAMVRQSAELSAVIAQNTVAMNHNSDMVQKLIAQGS